MLASFGQPERWLHLTLLGVALMRLLALPRARAVRRTLDRCGRARARAAEAAHAALFKS